MALNVPIKGFTKNMKDAVSSVRKEQLAPCLLLAGHPTPASPNPKLNSDCHRRLIIFFPEVGNFQHAQLPSMEKKKGLKVYMERLKCLALPL